jgi:tetratricopeptide (TPR) repeat protein
MNESLDAKEELPVATAPQQPRWGLILLGVALVALVGGAYALKTRATTRVAASAAGQDAAMKAGLDALYSKNDPAAAVSNFRKVLAINPNHYGATFQLAAALDRAGDPAEARLVWEKMLGMAEAVKDEATAAAARVRLQRPLSAAEQQGIFMKAGLDALYSRKDPNAAAAEFRKVLVLSPSHYGATYQLAVALDGAGKPGEARPLWEAVLKMASSYNDQPTAAAARARLARNP